MKKTLLATAIPAILFTSGASAIELYADDDNSFYVGGHISAGLIGSDNDSTGVNSVSPRINLGGSSALGGGWDAFTHVEFGLNSEQGSNTFWTRLAYVGVDHDTYGKFVAGTQWAPTYDITYFTDMPIAFANDFLYNNDMAHMGTGRADNMASYRNSFEFAENMAINFAVAGQGAQDVDRDGGEDRYDARYQAALSFDLDKFSVGAAYNSGDVNYASEGKKETATALNVSGKYGTYGNGIYAAVVYGQNEWSYRPDGRGGNFDLYEETSEFEVLLAYAFTNSVNIMVNYEEITDTLENDTVLNHAALQLEYNFTTNVVGYAGYQFDLGTDIPGYKDNNVWMIGARYYL